MFSDTNSDLLPLPFECLCKNKGTAFQLHTVIELFLSRGNDWMISVAVSKERKAEKTTERERDLRG